MEKVKPEVERLAWATLLSSVHEHMEVRGRLRLEQAVEGCINSVSW